MAASKKYFLMSLILYFSACYTQTAQNNEFKNYAGIKASNISGYGLYYSRNVSDNYRLQVMGLVYYYEYAKEEESEKIFNYDLGLEAQRNIYISENSRTYLLFGGYYYYDDDTDKNIDEVNSVNNSYNIGIGLGFEFEYKRIVYNLDIGYKFFEDNIDTYINGDFSYDELKRVTKLGAGVGIGFMF